ncbi:PAS domain S-box-containing protein [Catenuloplanes nepalensis]|uniref:PAS domain S-box-containing protein n=1 Tax=Catenuloplanes nepalensis TaxID=587533 RepID=A0ABT9N0X2_9ACTN|nr:PAS domain S-box protein [Catenuloplanes nepalensis]MDP9797314.1 PAS domain S-box-containing protein [Catenuloplanes nepalensis]
MRRTAVQPTGIERTFADHEIIVTKTDMKGLLTYANDVFLRLSVFDEEEVIGKPHNIIRHPDMPRVVFKLLWDTLREGREIFAYVVNMASDGAEYWVLAHVTPSRDLAGRIVGYHSSRRRPDRSAINAVKELYARLRAEEKRHRSPSEGLDASWRMLQDELSARGRTYEQFVFDLTLDAEPAPVPSPNAPKTVTATRDSRRSAGPAGITGSASSAGFAVSAGSLGSAGNAGSVGSFGPAGSASNAGSAGSFGSAGPMGSAGSGESHATSSRANASRAGAGKVTVTTNAARNKKPIKVVKNVTSGRNA